MHTFFYDIGLITTVFVGTGDSQDNQTMDRYLYWIIQQLEQQRVKLEARLQVPVSSSSSQFIYPPPIQDSHPQGLTSQMPVSQMPVATVSGPEHQTDTQGRASLKYVVSTMSIPPPKTKQGRTQTKDTHPIPGQKLKFMTAPGIEPRPPVWKAETLLTTPWRRIKSPPGIKFFSFNYTTNCLVLKTNFFILLR